MENVKISAGKVSLWKIGFDSEENYIVVSPDDPTLFDRFAAGFNHLADLADKLPAKIEEIEKQYEGDDFQSIMQKALAISRENVGISEEGIKTADGIFGEGTVRKFFHEAYEELPDFTPDIYSLLEFFEKILPEMEKIFNKRLVDREKASRARMAKYKPQDHKKPVRKS